MQKYKEIILKNDQKSSKNEKISWKHRKIYIPYPFLCILHLTYVALIIFIYNFVYCYLHINRFHTNLSYYFYDLFVTFSPPPYIFQLVLISIKILKVILINLFFNQKLIH